ncbi:MAG: flagellar biosynthesis protein FlhF [Clostridiales bacterium]|nr:flagellar biosynthesis protein FlhF [Clostridiales bacterium]
MLIKKYTVNNMNEALTRIRYELGKDAVIISQRKIKKPGIKGIFSKRQLEVTAAVENSSIDRNSKVKSTSIHASNNSYSRKGTSADYNMDKSINDLKNLMNKEIENKRNKQAVVDNNEQKKSEIESEVKEMKDMLKAVMKNTTKDSKDELLEFLSNSDIDMQFYDEFNEKLKGDFDVSKLRDIMSRDIKSSNDDLNGNVVLVGPTGVGKTTTIAKLAGNLSLVKKKKVGLITVDTYRIGAVEQLKTYAEIMNIPFEVVITIKEMEAAIKKMKDCDVVLIDTTGRSSKNKMQISELRAFVDKANATSINVVISATTKNKDIKTILEGYRILNYDKVIITKLDETSVYGSIYNISRIANKPIRYVTTGQNVPDDIKDFSKDEAIKLVFGEESVC